MSVKNMGVYRTAGIDSIFTSLKSRDLNYSFRKLCELALWILYYNRTSIAQENNRTTAEEEKGIYFQKNSTVNIEVSGKLYKVDFCNCLLSLSNFAKKLN